MQTLAVHPAPVRSWGSGPGEALALHCALAHSGAWEGVARTLPEGLRLRALDLPGHGENQPFDATRDFLDQTVAMALDLIGDAPVDLIGHSFGAVASLAIALARPDLVRRLVLYEPVFFAAAAADGFDTAPLRAFEAPLAAGDSIEAARRFHALWGAGTAWDTLLPRQRAARAEQMHLIPAANAAIHDDRAGILAPGRLQSLARPVLLLEGELSPPVVAAINGSLARRLPLARRATVKGASHMGPLTHPETVGAAIRAHLGL